MLRRYRPVAATLLLLAVLVAMLFSRVPVRTDMADFLPPGSTPATQFLFRELRSGAAATLILIALEGGSEAKLAATSRAMTEALRHSDAFTFVNNGAQTFGGDEQRLLFAYRYLLSPVTSASAFTVPALREKLRALLDELNSAAAPLVRRFGFADPVGAFLNLGQTWAGASHVELRQGVWFAADGKRALLVAKTSGTGLDIAAQQRALDAITAAHAEAGAPETRLLVSGPGVFAVESARTIRSDVEFIAILATVLLAALLLWQFRSVFIVIAIFIPLVAGTLAGSAAVALWFGFVHGITLGFGMTMLGVAVDYPILLLSQRRPGEAAAAAARRIWPTMLVAVVTAALGVMGMLLSSFPGLSQLGLFSAVGLLVAASVTRFVLPAMLAASGISPVPPPRWWPALAAHMPRWRVPAALLLVAAALLLLISGGPGWEKDLANLSPIAEAKLRLDGELRREVGAPDVRHLVAFSGQSAEDVLLAAEALDRELAPLVKSGAVGGVEIASRFLPSQATQLARRAALPEPETLRARLEEAAAGMPFRLEAFRPFLDDVAASRALEPLTMEGLRNPLLAARLEPLLFRRDGTWHGMAALVDVRDGPAVAAALAQPKVPQAIYIDVKGETDALVASYAGESLRWIGLGGIAVLLSLGLGLRSAKSVLRVAFPIAGALLITLAVLQLLGLKMTLFHLVSLLLMVGVSLDYSLFANRAGTMDQDGGQTVRSIVICNASTLLTFGLLVFCDTPALRGIGTIVAIGALSAILLSLVFAPRGAAATA